jgi:hypothetical protein
MSEKTKNNRKWWLLEGNTLNLQTVSPSVGLTPFLRDLNRLFSGVSQVV